MQYLVTKFIFCCLYVQSILAHISASDSHRRRVEMPPRDEVPLTWLALNDDNTFSAKKKFFDSQGDVAVRYREPGLPRPTKRKVRMRCLSKSGKLNYNPILYLARLPHRPKGFVEAGIREDNFAWTLYEPEIFENETLPVFETLKGFNYPKKSSKTKNHLTRMSRNRGTRTTYIKSSGPGKKGEFIIHIVEEREPGKQPPEEWVCYESRDQNSVIDEIFKTDEKSLRFMSLKGYPLGREFPEKWLVKKVFADQKVKFIQDSGEGFNSFLNLDLKKMFQDPKITLDDRGWIDRIIGKGQLDGKMHQLGLYQFDEGNGVRLLLKVGDQYLLSKESYTRPAKAQRQDPRNVAFIIHSPGYLEKNRADILAAAKRLVDEGYWVNVGVPVALDKTSAKKAINKAKEDYFYYGFNIFNLEQLTKSNVFRNNKLPRTVEDRKKLFNKYMDKQGFFNRPEAYEFLQVTMRLAIDTLKREGNGFTKTQLELAIKKLEGLDLNFFTKPIEVELDPKSSVKKELQKTKKWLILLAKMKVAEGFHDWRKKNGYSLFRPD